MPHHSAHRRRMVISGLAALVIASCSWFNACQAATVAVTSDFTENGSNLPTSASTLFNEPTWSNGDPLDTAEHELFHAIGFTIAYTNFAAHVQAPIAVGNPNAGDRPFTLNTNGTGGTLALLTPADDGTHVDPAAGVVNGRNQNLSIMQPSLVNGQRINAWEAQILNAAFGWDTRNIKINVVYATTFTAAQKTNITDAVTAVQNIFGSNGTGSVFTWTVSVASVPEPSSIALVGLGSVLIVGANRRRRLKTLTK